MSTKSRVSFSSAGRGGTPVTETSATRRRIQDVLGQARAALRQSQQLRLPSESKNDSVGSKLQFQQQPQDDYWSTPGAGGVISQATVENEKLMGTRTMENKTAHPPYKTNQQDDFGMPFRDAMKKSGAPAATHQKTPSQHRKVDLTGAATVDQVNSDASTTSISMSTNDLRVSDGSEDYSSSEESHEANSQGSVKRTIKSATTRSSKIERKLKEWEVQSTMKLTPLNTAVTSLPAETLGDIGISEANIETSNVIDEDGNGNSVPPSHSPLSTGNVAVDDMGLSRAHIRNKEDDPLWFEKALLTRRETISEAAYNAFKQTQSVQLKQETEDSFNKNVAMAKKTTEKPNFNNFIDPEYTADWISDGGLNSSLISEVDMPISDYIRDEDIDISKTEVEVPLDSIVDNDDEVNSESMIRTATELETSGVLDEIADNLHSVLDISDYPESQYFTGMTAEEKSFAKEYDEAMEDDDEPLQSIFLDGKQDRSKGSMSINTSKSISGTTGQDETTGTKISGVEPRDDEEEEDDYDDNTFIQLDTTVSSVTKSKSVSKRRSSKSIQQLSSTLMSTSGSKQKKSTSSMNTSSAPLKSSKTLKSKLSTSIGTGAGATVSEKLKSKSASTKSKSYASTSSTTSKRLNSLPIPPEPPASRHQKNIQNILEKEIYQKEVKRIRSEQLRQERDQKKLEKNAQECLDRNKKTAYKDPNFTEILLPELFKYKSVSGLQAAKAKRSVLKPSMNYGAPYFQMNGAVSGAEGTESMLAAARVESLDIPDLVREVLASNERMYRMTVEASEKMAKKAYKDKLRKDMTRNVNKR